MNPNEQPPKATDTLPPIQSADQLLMEKPVGPALPPQPQPQPYASQVEPPKKKHRVRNVILVLVALLVGFVGVVVTMTLLKTRVTVGDLVTEKKSGVSYLRPQQWSPVESGKLHGYGDLQGDNGKSTALVVVFKSPEYFAELTGDAGDDFYNDLRRTLVDQPFTLSLEALSPDCKGENTTSKTEIDTTSTATAVGLIKASTTCKTKDGTSTLKLRGVAGKDGYLRIIGVFGPESFWQLNAEAYQKMLDSVDQTE